MINNIKKISNYVLSNQTTKEVLFYIIAVLGIFISAQISIPLSSGVPVTLQTFAVAFLGYSVSSKKGISSILMYLLAGAIGIPVFAQFNGGLSSLLGLTGGFLFGFIFLVYFCAKARNCNHLATKIILGIIGLLLCHICGIIQYSILTGMNLVNSTMLVSIPFLAKDTVSVILAFCASRVSD